jgi:hypothetical protein
MNNIKKVHVIYKTHLDVGFTDLAKNVVDKYINSFIPKAIQLANKVNKEGKDKKFIWTVGSWMIEEYLRRSCEDAKGEFIDAVNKGYIVWHGLPFTTHSELMDRELFDFGISISKELDKTFSTNTIAAKMTDVPGHTRGIIEPLCSNGIKYLHIGVNDVSHKPNVPDTFIWRDSRGNEIIVDYCQGYGKTTIVPGFDEVIVFAHSGDNMGPPAEDEIYKQLEYIQNQFPEAKVEASTLNKYAEALLRENPDLPIVTEEIGDTWIHGAATDPYKVSGFYELLRLKDKWLSENKLIKDSEVYKNFMRNMLMIPEHTWGLDFKKYMADFKNWSKKDFQKARVIDKLSDSYIPEKYAELGEFARHEFEAQIQHMKWNERSYSYFESSHEEQRKYIDCAVEELPLELKDEALKAINLLKVKPKLSEESQELLPGNQYDIEDYSISVLNDGSLRIKIQDFDLPVTLGKIGYELFGISTYEKWKREYMVHFEKYRKWGTPDFLKPGVENTGAPKENLSFQCKLKQCFLKGNELIIEAVFNDYECEEYGCPRNVCIKYTFNKGVIDIVVFLSQKEANRIPEALWVSHFVDNPSIKDVKYNKLDEMINPFEIVECGNRNYHLVKEVGFKLDEKHINIMPIDSKLISLGEKRLYNFSQQYADPSGGMHFNIYNNLWGTNFKMWYEEDIISRFRIILLTPP